MMMPCFSITESSSGWEGRLPWSLGTKKRIMITLPVRRSANNIIVAVLSKVRTEKYCT